MWFIDIIRRHREERFLKDLMATKGMVDFVSDRRARQILSEMRFDSKCRLYFLWAVSLCKWTWGKLTRKKVLKEEQPVQQTKSPPVELSEGLFLRPLGEDEK